MSKNCFEKARELREKALEALEPKPEPEQAASTETTPAATTREAPKAEVKK